MASFYQVGDELDFVPAAETAIGALVEVYGKVGIVNPTHDGAPLAIGALGSVRINCVVELDNSGVIFAEGATVGYDATDDDAVAGGGGDFDCGVCVNPGGATAAEKVRVLLS